jgi:hypothetical protein
MICDSIVNNKYILLPEPIENLRKIYPEDASNGVEFRDERNKGINVSWGIEK